MVRVRSLRNIPRWKSLRNILRWIRPKMWIKLRKREISLRKSIKIRRVRTRRETRQHLSRKVSQRKMPSLKQS